MKATGSSVNRSGRMVVRLVRLDQKLLLRWSSSSSRTVWPEGAGTKRALSSARPLPVEMPEEWTPRRVGSTVLPSSHVNGRDLLRSSHLRMDTTPNAAASSQEVGPVPRPVEFDDDGEEEIREPTNELPVAVQSPQMLTYTEGEAIPIVSRLHIVTPEEDTPRGIWPVFRLMDENGTFRDPIDGSSDFGAWEENHQTPAAFPGPKPARDDLEALRIYLSQAHPHHADEFERSGLLYPSKSEYSDVQTTNTLYRAYRQMIRLKEMDHILLNAQRQGRISFYMTCRGEEAIHMGAGSALDLQDPIFAQYREQGLLMWRGFTLEQFTNQCFSNDLDLGKGRQMPVHYGSRALNYQTVSSPLGTQLPQAVGAAYRLKLSGRPHVAACFFGDGCASTTDFHSALNFAATLNAPVLFFCRNNGYAISTPTSDQYRGDGIVCRAPGYGMAAIRVDGNDIFAVHAAVREARRYALEHSAPVLIEAMTYRLGHHSTSDDSTRYRPMDEVSEVANQFDPILRLANFLQRHEWLTVNEEASMRDEEKVAVLKAMEQAERRPPPSLDSMFEDVYHEMPRHLVRQQAQLRDHISKYPKKYNK